MNSGDEPQLGGQSDDNSPMISSTATRAIANPAGVVYLENLRNLCISFTDSHLLTFSQAVTEQALAYTSKIWTLLEAEAAHIALLDATRHWIDNPSQQNQSNVWRLFSPLFGSQYNVPASVWMRVSTHVPPDVFLAIVCTATLTVAHYPRMQPGPAVINTARLVAAILFSGTRPLIEREVTRARTWQLEAARAILHDVPIPPLELTP
jgi:hypothetical protein